jgi:hypothetical protein
LDCLVVPARVQGVEVGDAVDTEHDRLAVNDELLEPDLQRRLDDPQIAIGSVVAASGDQAGAIPLALQAEAIAVVLDLYEGLACQEVFSRSAFLLFLRFKKARASAVLH